MNNKSYDAKVIVFCLALSVLIFVMDALIPLGVAGGVPYVLVVLISFRSATKKLPIYAAFWGTILTFVGLFTSPSGGEEWQVLSNRLLAIFAIWITAVLGLQREKALEEKEKATSDLKILRGFLPICSTCKRIRDDSGCWTQIESYIREHSEAEFSHGICSDCVKKLYSDTNLI